MCQECDYPHESPEEYFDRVREMIGRSRFAVIAIGGSRDEAEFCYSVGLTEHGLPELIVMGLDSDPATRLVRVWGDYLLDERVVLAGERLTSGPWHTEAVRVAFPREHLLSADALYGDRVQALQLVWADNTGRMPWDPGHDPGPAGQPLLGPRAARYCEEHALDRLDVPPHL